MSLVTELAKILAAAISGSESKQLMIVIELKRLNDNIERIWPKAADPQPAPDEPLLGDDPLTLAMAEDARQVLYDELKRDPTTEEILERISLWRDRSNPVRTRGTTSSYDYGR